MGVLQGIGGIAHQDIAGMQHIAEHYCSEMFCTPAGL